MNQVSKIFLIYFCFLVTAQNLYCDLPTYFTYSAKELNDIKKIPVSNQTISYENISKWNDLTYELTSDSTLTDGKSLRFFAYLYTAQRDAAFLSHNLHQKFLGTVDPITIKVLSLFFPDHKFNQSFESDPYSEAIANVVFEKTQARYERENKHLKEYPEKVGAHYWKEEPPLIGRKIGTCQTWLVNSIEKYRLPEPPPYSSIIWDYGINQIKEAEANLTAQQQYIIDYWAGNFGPKSGNWMAIANDYIDVQKPQLQLKDLLLFRSVYAMGLVDSMISCFDSKYSYWVPRPKMRDPDLKTILKSPKHPSYPSGHSVMSSAAVTILSHFFPNDTANWRNLAFQAGNSRIWAGIHYMYDNEQGLLLGEKIANAALKNKYNTEENINFEKKLHSLR